MQDVVRADVRVHALRAASSGGRSCRLRLRRHARDRPAARPARRSPRPARRRPPAAPLCSTMMRSASSRTTSILCSTSRIGLVACAPSARGSGRGSPARRRRSCRRSARRTCRPSGRAPSASPPRACAGRRAAGWPPCASRLSASRTARRMRARPSIQRAAVEPDAQQVEPAVPRRSRACTARRTFSSTVRLGNSCVSWKARPRPRCVRARRRQSR